MPTARLRPPLRGEDLGDPAGRPSECAKSEITVDPLVLDTVTQWISERFAATGPRRGRRWRSPPRRGMIPPDLRARTIPHAPEPETAFHCCVPLPPDRLAGGRRAGCRSNSAAAHPGTDHGR